jgi:predicted dehydrogenase
MKSIGDEENSGFCTGTVSTEGFKVDREDPYTRQVRHFCRDIEGKELPKASGEDARMTVEATLAIQKSGETGQPVTF